MKPHKAIIWLALLAIVGLVVAHCAAALAQPLYTSADLREVPEVINGPDTLKQDSWKFDAGLPTTRGGLIVDEADCDQRITREVHNVRGDGVRLIKTKSPAYDRLQIPTLEIAARNCYRGIVVDSSCPDAILLNPRVATVRDEGVWLEAGNVTIIGGHSYGAYRPLKIGGHANSGGGMVNGMTFSDGMICCDILTNNVMLTGCYSQDGFTHNIRVGGQASIFNQRIDVRPADAEFTHPVGVEFLPGVGNWSTMIGGIVGVGMGSDGIVLNSDCTDVLGVSITGAEDIDAIKAGTKKPATALRIKNAINGCSVDVRVCNCTGGVVIEKLGAADNIRLRGQVSEKNCTLPKDWHPTTHIWINEVEVTAKGTK